MTVDTSYNYAFQGTNTLSASGAGLGTSIGAGLTFTNALNTQDLTGVSSVYGATLSDVIGISVDVLRFVPQSNPNTVNWGISIYIVTGPCVEVHWGESFTTSTNSWNPIKKLKTFLFGG